MFLTVSLATACGSGASKSDSAGYYGTGSSASTNQGSDQLTPPAEKAVPDDSQVEGRVSYCHDGDTCTVYLNGDSRSTTVRLAGIDAPEVSGGVDHTGQPYGQEARDFLNGRIKGKRVMIHKIATDMYGRTLGEIYYGKRLVDIALVKGGYAEAYKWADGVNRAAYRSAEATAKAASIGIWALDDYQSPGAFRRESKQRGYGN